MSHRIFQARVPLFGLWPAVFWMLRGRRQILYPDADETYLLRLKAGGGPAPPERLRPSPAYVPLDPNPLAGAGGLILRHWVMPSSLPPSSCFITQAALSVTSTKKLPRNKQSYGAPGEQEVSEALGKRGPGTPSKMQPLLHVPGHHSSALPLAL